MVFDLHPSPFEQRSDFAQRTFELIAGSKLLGRLADPNAVGGTLEGALEPFQPYQASTCDDLRNQIDVLETKADRLTDDLLLKCAPNDEGIQEWDEETCRRKMAEAAAIYRRIRDLKVQLERTCPTIV